MDVDYLESNQTFYKKELSKRPNQQRTSRYVLKKKNIIGKYYETFLTILCNQSQDFYKKIGFKESNERMHKLL